MKFVNLFSRRRPTEVLKAPTVTFVGEQDGPSERMLKGKLSELFGARKNVQKAYLARAHYGDPKAVSVCLCIGVIGGVDETLVEQVHSLFAKLFNKATHLDIIFLSGKQEEQLAAVCKPFCRRT
jgi:type III secretion system (T3SS) SseB-like protein